MTSSEILNIRLLSQLIAATRFKTIRDTVAYMAAMQAQDYSMAKWAVGIRHKGSTEKQVEEAIDKGEIVRTHLLRPTWNFVSAEDVRWMLELSAPHIKAGLRSRHKELEIDESFIKRCNKIIMAALSDHMH